MFVNILLFILGFVLLIFGGDWFVDGSSGIARKLKISEIIIGATVVSIGTTLPEVMVSSQSAALGHGELAYGNAIGSIICNTALVAAITMTFNPKKIEKKSLITPLIFFFSSAAAYALIAYISGEFSRWFGILLLVTFVVYIVINLVTELKKEKTEEPVELNNIEKEQVKEKPIWLNIIKLVLGATMIAFGARFLVDNGTEIAKALGVPESVIGLTFIALGTSLPELVTAIVSLIKGHSDLSLGNIIGANLFNIILVGGMSITINPFAVPVEKTLLGYNASLIVDIPLMFIVMIIMTIPSIIKGKISRWQGILLLTLYAGFAAFQFIG